MAALTTLFTPASWCSNRFAVFVDDHSSGTSIIPPSSGWVDPSFTKCIPTQYLSAFPTFSPGVCPVNMEVVKHTSEVHDDNTIWTAACCQSGFSTVSWDPEYLCTSSITSPMAFLLDPNISTADVYTTLAPELYIEHDQVTVQWEPTDLKHFPVDVASQYRIMMGITAQPLTVSAASETEESVQGPLTTISATRTTASHTSVFWPTPSGPRTSTAFTWTTDIEAQPTAAPTTTSDGSLLRVIGPVTLAVIFFATTIWLVA
ncbi:hypothetical protein F5Y03DRAFT_86836 [Xylaria venustula]|nr:hypothetical protein F5Y03DRAFT_86836 [Xylaria venustula]